MPVTIPFTPSNPRLKATPGPSFSRMGIRPSPQGPGLGNVNPDVAPASPSPSLTGVSRVPVGISGSAVDPTQNQTFQQPITPGQMAERNARMARSGTPNLGGTISTEVAPGITATQRYAGSPSASMAPNRPNMGGTMTRGGATTMVAPSASRAPIPVAGLAAPSGAPVESPTTEGADGTESADPLSGDGNDRVGGTEDTINPGSALGLNRNGANVPRGTDAQPSSYYGGSGLYSHKFANQKSAGNFSDYVKKLFA